MSAKAASILRNNWFRSSISWQCRAAAVFLTALLLGGWAAQASAQSVQLSDAAWGAFTKIVGKDLVLDATNNHARFTALNAKTIVLDQQDTYQRSFSRKACYYLKGNRRVQWLPASSDKKDANGCGSGSGEHIDLIVTDDGWSGDSKYHYSTCGILCPALAAENQETGVIQQNGNVVIVSGSSWFGDDADTRSFRNAFASPDLIFYRQRARAASLGQMDPAKWGVFAKLAGKDFGLFDIQANQNGDPVLVYDDRSPTFFQKGLNGNYVRIEGPFATGYSATVAVAQDGWVEHWGNYTYTYTLRDDGSLLRHYAGERTAQDTILRTQDHLPTMADLKVDQGNDEAARQSLAREEARQASLRAEAERQAAAERLARAEAQSRMMDAIAGVRSGSGGSGSRDGGSSGGGGLYAYCASQAAPMAFFSAIFPASDYNVTAMANAFHGFVKSQHPELVIGTAFCFVKNNLADAASERGFKQSNWAGTYRIVNTDWRFGN